MSVLEWMFDPKLLNYGATLDLSVQSVESAIFNFDYGALIEAIWVDLNRP